MIEIASVIYALAHLLAMLAIIRSQSSGRSNGN